VAVAVVAVVVAVVVNHIGGTTKERINDRIKLNEGKIKTKQKKRKEKISILHLIFGCFHRS
jgi:hypothetical protein